MWNLLDNQAERDMPLLTTADWLKFVVGRSSADQVELTHIMAKILLRARWADACCQKMFSGWKISQRARRAMEHELDAMTASCDKARRSAHRDRVLLSEARIQSSELQVEMREDVEALELRLKETGEQLCEVKTRLVHVKEATAASKARADRQVAQLAIEKAATVDAMRELRNNVAELNEALGLSHVEEARLCTLGVELREQVAALTNEKETNMVSWARDNRARDATIEALKRVDESRATELEALKAELARVRGALAAVVVLPGAGVTSSGQTGGVQVQPIPEDPAVTRLHLGMDTPYVDNALQVEARRGREPMGDTRREDRAVGAGIMLTPSRIPSSPLGFQDPGQSSSQGLTALTQNVISGKAVHLIGARITPEDVKKIGRASCRERV
jgi:hypothetical protein